MVWRLEWMAMWLTISNMRTRKCSLASCKASKAVDWKRYCIWNIWHTISFTRRWNGIFLISRSVLFWYFLICLSATVPGLNRLGLRICPRGFTIRLRGGRTPLPIVLKGCDLLRTMLLVDVVLTWVEIKKWYDVRHFSERGPKLRLDLLDVHWYTLDQRPPGYSPISPRPWTLSLWPGLHVCMPSKANMCT